VKRGRATHSRRALIVEDCEDDHDLLVLSLRQAGFEPSTVRVETVPEINEALARRSGRSS